MRISYDETKKVLSFDFSDGWAAEIEIQGVSAADAESIENGVEKALEAAQREGWQEGNDAAKGIATNPYAADES
jgi:flagellar biosynthesis/type III secretory pathway protein FliH